MFDITKFGVFISHLRKESDMTQSELGDLIGVTRQAISKYERGESFPDVSILRRISEIFGVSIDVLVGAGEPSEGEAKILQNAAYGRVVAPDSLNDVVSLAPLLKPSLLSALSESMTRSGLDISNLVSLSEYLCDEDSKKLMSKVSFDSVAEMDMVLLERILPIAGPYAAYTLFTRVIDGELGLEYLDLLYPYYSGSQSLVEAAVLYGVLDSEALNIMRRHEYNIQYSNKTGMIPQIFVCPSCKAPMRYFYPQRCKCGFKPEIKDNIVIFGEGEPHALTPDTTTAEKLLGAASNGLLLITGCPDNNLLEGLCISDNIRVIIADSDIDRLRRAERHIRYKSVNNIMLAQMDTDSPDIADGMCDVLLNLAGTPDYEVKRLIGRDGNVIANGKLIFNEDYI